MSTERQRNHSDSEPKLRFLAEASEILASSLDYRSTLDNLTRLVVSFLADWCTITLLKEDGSIDRICAAHADESKQELLDELQRSPRPTAELQPALFAALTTGDVKLLQSVTGADRARVSRDPAQSELMDRIGMESVIVVPLVSRQKTIGAIFMARSNGRQSFRPEDSDLALELGRRAATAVENSLLHLETRQLNEKLERRVTERTAELEAANEQLEEQIAVRRRTEAELRNREAQLHRAQRVTHLGTWAWYPSTGELTWSEETYRIFGFTRDAKPTFDTFLITTAPGDRDRIRAIIFEAVDRKTSFTFEHQLIRADGSRAFVRSDGEVTVDEHGEVTEVFGTALDITRLRAADEAVRESEMRFRFLAEHALHIVATVQRDGTIGYMSPSVRQVMGYEPHQLVGTNCLDLVHPDDERNASRNFQLLLGNPGEPYRLSYRYRHGDGTWRVLEVLGKLPSHDSQRAIINAHDITDRVHAEREIRALNAELKRSSAQLTATNEELEAFAYSVSHDLRAPLRGIDGFSQALAEDYSTQFDGVANGYLNRIRAGAARMGELIDDLLDLSRLSRSKMERETVDLSELAVNIAAELARREPARNVELSVDPGLEADGDRRLLTLLLQNLLENAWKFTRHRESARIEVGRTDAGGATAYFVRDNGAGFEMAYAKRLFGAFQRLHSQDQFEGTGIGLATVQRIVNRHDGRIWATGEVDVGATFYFTIEQRGWQSVQV